MKDIMVVHENGSMVLPYRVLLCTVVKINSCDWSLSEREGGGGGGPFSRTNGLISFVFENINMYIEIVPCHTLK